MTCITPRLGEDLCPTADQIVPQLLALLPRGRAWGTHDGGPAPGTTLYQFWYAVAVVWAYVNTRICDLARQFFCSTADETHDVWMEEYGLPDGCDPFPDLCSKVAALGGTRCEYFTAIAARAGWSITCADVVTACGTRAGQMRAGCASVGKGLAPGILMVTVALSESPAFVGGAPTNLPDTPFAGLAPPLAGRFMAGGLLSCRTAGGVSSPLAGALMAGRILGCVPDLSALECLLARIVHADILVIYETTP